MIETERLTALLVAVTLGEDSPEELTAEEREAWERLADQVKEIKRRGGVVDVPGGLPLIDLPDSDWHGGPVVLSGCRRTE